MEKAIKKFNFNINKANTEQAKKKCILALVMRLCQIHPFIDHNCRTFMCLLFALFVRYGFIPPMLNDPCKVRWYTLSEFCIEVKDGVELTRTLTESMNNTKSSMDQRLEAASKTMLEVQRQLGSVNEAVKRVFDVGQDIQSSDQWKTGLRIDRNSRWLHDERNRLQEPVGQESSPAWNRAIVCVISQIRPV